MIITTEEVKRLGRNISAHIDKATIEALIKETENREIRPVLGVTFFQNLVEGDTEEPFAKLLLNGGYYPHIFDPTFDATFTQEAIVLDAHFQGLKTAVAYYVQAKLVKTADSQMTRYGLMQKDSEYGYRPSTAERNDQYNDLVSIADQYMRDTLEYLNIYSERYPLFNGSGKRVKNNRTIYRILGT